MPSRHVGGGRDGPPSARPSGTATRVVALVGIAVTAVQALYWTVLPNYTFPTDRLPIAAAIVLHSAVWLFFLNRRG